MVLDRRTFLFGLPLLGLLKPRAPRPVLSVASLPEDTVITVWPGHGKVGWYFSRDVRESTIYIDRVHDA